MCASSPDLGALRSKAPEISKILQQGDSLLDSALELHFPELYSEVVLPDIRVLHLNGILDKMDRVLRISKPSVSCMEDVLCKLASLRARILESREKLQDVVISTQVAHLSELEEEIRSCEGRLNAVNRLVDHLDPQITSIDTGDGAHLESLLESAEKMVESKRFCDSISAIPSIDASDLVKEASERIEASLNKICELSLLWLQKETYRLYNTQDSIMQPFIVPSNSSVESLFEMDLTPSRGSYFATEQEGMTQDSAKTCSAVRILNVLRTRPKYFEIFMDNIKDLLTHLSQRRFKNLLLYAGKNLYDIFMNLQLTLTMIKSSVVALYNNANLENEDPATLVNAISGQLLRTLESKLDYQVQDNLEGVLELFRNIHICSFYREKLESVLNGDGSLSGRTRIEAPCNPILTFLDKICNEWRDSLHNVQDSETSTPVISLFLHKLVDIQLEFTDTRDFYKILEKTIANSLALCNNVGATYQIYKPLQSSIVPQEYASAIKSKLDEQVKKEYTDASEAILRELNVTKNDSGYSSNDENISTRISSIVYSESLESFEVIHNVSLLPEPIKRQILHKLYLFVVNVYKSLNGDSTKVKEMTDMVNGFIPFSCLEDEQTSRCGRSP